jgi:hypothetical protein
MVFSDLKILSKFISWPSSIRRTSLLIPISFSPFLSWLWGWTCGHIFVSPADVIYYICTYFEQQADPNLDNFTFKICPMSFHSILIIF